MVKKDPQGPEHYPKQSFVSDIEGIVIAGAPVVSYSEGFLTELYRPEWHGVFAKGEPIEHLYAVFAPKGGMRKEWYFHEHTLDRYMVLIGQLDIGLYDGRKESSSFETFEVVSLSAHNQNLPNSIRIPPGVWHSLSWRTPEGLFINAKLPGFNRKDVDKFRIPLEELPEAISWNLPND